MNAYKMRYYAKVAVAVYWLLSTSLVTWFLIFHVSQPSMLVELSAILFVVAVPVVTMASILSICDNKYGILNGFRHQMEQMRNEKHTFSLPSKNYDNLQYNEVLDSLTQQISENREVFNPMWRKIKNTQKIKSPQKT